MSFEEKLKRMKIKHKLFNWQFDYNDLRNTNELKVYTEGSHFDRKLVEHKETGMLFLYEFYEHENFGGSDEMYETYAVVENAADADMLNKERFIRRAPYIFIDDEFNVTVSE